MEWDLACCVICKEHPHNAIVLVCSSSDLGCRSVMCNTSKRLSNCLNEFQRRSSNHDDTSLPEIHNELAYDDNNYDIFYFDDDYASQSLGLGASSSSSRGLRCPLCRGTVTGWVALDDSIRRFLNRKIRRCPHGTCPFRGDYADLDVHAQTTHPNSRLYVINPTSEVASTRVGEERDVDNVLSAMESNMPHTQIQGDYTIGNGDQMPQNRRRRRLMVDTSD